MSAAGSRVVRWAGGGGIAGRVEGPWPEVAEQRYKEGGAGFCGVTRRKLVGAGDDGLAGELRYFEIAAGGCSSYERHDHAHAVVVLTGRGHVRLGAELSEIAPFDLVYVAPQTPHRFLADAGERLGFLCFVDRERDTPVALPEPTEGPPEGPPRKSVA